MSPVGLGFGNGNGECRRCSWIAAQAAASAGRLTLYIWFEKNSTDGFKKLGPKATLADAAQDKEIMKMLSDSEAQEVIQKLKNQL